MGSPSRDGDVKVCVLDIHQTELAHSFYSVLEEKSLYSLFRNVIPEIIFDFLREIGVFYKI